MKIILGHSNLDLDCIGCMALSRYLYPDYKPVMSRFLNPAAKNLYNLYLHHLDFLPVNELKTLPIEDIIIVDTRSQKRVQEYFDLIKNYNGKIVVYDHHPTDGDDIPNAIINENSFGSNTTYFVHEIIKNKITIGPEDATIALTAIYADTGSFNHENIKYEDFDAASFLLKCKASIPMVKNHLSSLKEDHQVSFFHQLVHDMIYQNFNGHLIALSYMELEKQVGGLAAIVEKTFEVENIDAIFAVFFFKKEKDVLIVARSQKNKIEVNKILAEFGGGGHAQASSALIKESAGGRIFKALINHLAASILPADSAEKIMKKEVCVIRPEWSLVDASMYLENVNQTGAPVVDESGKMVGFISLRNIMKGRKSGDMHSLVKAFMTTKVVTATKDFTVRQIESIFFKNNIGHLPIVENGNVIGIVTRSDYLNYLSSDRVAAN